jgi:hypothetical protein
MKPEYFYTPLRAFRTHSFRTDQCNEHHEEEGAIDRHSLQYLVVYDLLDDCRDGTDDVVDASRKNNAVVISAPTFSRVSLPALPLSG